MELFLGVVILHPTDKQAEEGEQPMIVVPLAAVLGKDKSHAALRLSRLVPSEYENDDARLEVRVMTFPK